MGSQGAAGTAATNLGAGQFYGRVASRRSASGLVLSEAVSYTHLTLPTILRV